MANKKTYTSVLIEIEGRLSSIETTTKHQENHLGNIDQHLNRLNERTGDCEVQTAKNSTRISLVYKIGGSILGIMAILATLAFGILNLFD